MIINIRMYALKIQGPEAGNFVALVKRDTGLTTGVLFG